jgi:hypothetical protein
MDKVNKYKHKYESLLNTFLNTQHGGKHDKKCLIEDTDNILFGDGGSTSIIAITPQQNVYKIYTLYLWKDGLDVNQFKKIQDRNITNEISIIKALTKSIYDKNISHHIVKYIGDNKCANARNIFVKKCKSYTEFLKLDKENKKTICDTYFQGYPKMELQSKYNVLQMEYCDYNCANFLSDISKCTVVEMEKYLDIFIFQIVYTICAIREVYPYFVHNDLFIRNIMGKKEKDNGNYYKYMILDYQIWIPNTKVQNLTKIK